MDGTTGYPLRQIEQAAKDPAVKAVVVRIDSPGGTITASEDLHRDLVDLRDNTHPRFQGTGPKPLVVSMGGIAASGGYYIAMPAKTVFAEPTTITGSIGVFAALPNVSELAKKHGVKLELDQGRRHQGERVVVPRADPRGAAAVAGHGRPRLRPVPDRRRRRPAGADRKRTARRREDRAASSRRYDDKGNPIDGPDGKPATVRIARYRADGGIFTPPQAKELGLIDDDRRPCRPPFGSRPNPPD